MRSLNPFVRPEAGDGRLGLLLTRVQKGVQFFDCGRSLLSHGVEERKRLNLGNLNPISERELTKLDVHQEEEEEEEEEFP